MTTDGYEYTREKLWQALGCLIQEGALQRRLAGATNFIIRLDAKNFPDELLPRFLKVQKVLFRNSAETNGIHDGSNPAPLTKAELEEAADGVLALFVKLKGGISLAGAKTSFDPD